MLKPDFLDLDKDGNKTEPMKDAAKDAKERDGMAEGGELEERLQYGIGGLLSKLIKKVKANAMGMLENSEKEEKEEEFTPSPTTLMMQDGGDVDSQMSMLMKKEQQPPMESDEKMEDNYIDFILDEALSEEEEDMLMSKLEQDEQLSMLFDKVIEVASEFAGSGPVEGPGSGISDSIPARLSDGEFVFTAKAVKELGSDNLMDLMKTAEMEADQRQDMANGGQMEEEETVTLESENEPVRQDIRVTKETLGPQATMQEEKDLVGDELKRRMMDPSTQSSYVRS